MDLQRFRIYHPAEGADYTTHDLTIIPADRMRAERASTAELPPAQRGPGATKAHPNTWLLLWLWCSATRVGATSAKFPDWSATVLDFDPLDAQGQPVTAPAQAETLEAEAVDPTTGAGPTT